MKLIITTVAAALISTTAFAGNSDRYNDQRLDTSAATQTTTDTPVLTLSSLSARNGTKASGTYAYTSPYGVGPSNDSR